MQIGVQDPNLAAPIEYIPTDDRNAQLEHGIALCLSGGGYRAMLFHVGALIRLNQFGSIGQVARVSSVSGGSIAAGALALNWPRFHFDGNGRVADLDELLVQPLRRMASKTIDVASILGGVLSTQSISDKVADEYREMLFGHSTLQDLPDKPRFVFNATNVQSKALFRFSKPYIWDWRVGRIDRPQIEIAVAVAASSAFPPVLSPAELHLNPADFVPGSGADLQFEPYTSDVVLTDGGVYDNLGLETAWKRYDTLWVSDGGGMYAPEPDPKRDWLGHTRRVMDLVDNQVRSLRKRQLVESFNRKLRAGAYWGIWTDIEEFGLPDALPCPKQKADAIAATPTRLKKLSTDDQDKIINWGYAICDAAMRKYGGAQSDIAPGFPYPIGLG
jgi:NTE family protein